MDVLGEGEEGGAHEVGVKEVARGREGGKKNVSCQWVAMEQVGLLIGREEGREG